MKTIKSQYLILCLAAALFYSCDQGSILNNDAPDADTTLTDTIAKDGTAKAADTVAVQDGPNAEFIDYNTIKINGKVGFYGNAKKLVAALGTADSVYKVTDKSTRYECGTFFGSKGLTVVYLKNTEFERVRDSVVFRGISFKDANTFVEAGKLKLSAATTLSEIKKLFPKSTKDSPVIDADGFKQKVVAVSLPIAARESEDKWVLLFDSNTGKLLRFEYWIPC